MKKYLSFDAQDWCKMQLLDGWLDLTWSDLSCVNYTWSLPLLWSSSNVFEVEYFGSLGPVGNLTSGLATRCLSWRWIFCGHVDLLFCIFLPQVHIYCRVLLSASIRSTALFSCWDSEGSWWFSTQVPSSVFKTVSLPFPTSLILGAQQADADKVTWFLMED